MEVREMFEVLRGDIQTLEQRVNQRMDDGFKAVNQRMEDGFKAVDQRFEAVDKRFEAVDKRIDDMGNRIDDMGNRIDDMGNRIESVRQEMYAGRIFKNASIGTAVAIVGVCAIVGSFVLQLAAAL